MIYFDKDGVLLRSPSDPPDVLERFSFRDRRWTPYGLRAGDILEQLQRLTVDEAVDAVFRETSGTNADDAKALVETETVAFQGDV